MPLIASFFGANAALSSIGLRQESLLTTKRSSQGMTSVGKTDYETIGIISILMASAGALVSRLWSGRKTVSVSDTKRQDERDDEGADPYRSPSRVADMNRAPVRDEENFSFRIPSSRTSIAFENLTLSRRTRLDTKLELKKIGSGWWIKRLNFGRCAVRLMSQNGHFEDLKPNVLYPVRSDESLQIDDVLFSVQMESLDFSRGSPLENSDVIALNREVLLGNIDVIRRCGACIGMIHRMPMLAGELEHVGVPSTVYAFVDPATGLIRALVHNGHHPRPYAGIPHEIQRKTARIRLDLMANDLAGPNDRRHIGRCVLEDRSRDAVNLSVEALHGQMFQPLTQAIDARRALNFP